MTSLQEPYESELAVPGPGPRPRSLRLGYAAAVIAGLLGLGGAIALMVNAKGLAEQTVGEILGADSGVLGTQLLQQAVSEATHTLTMRGSVGAVVAVLVLVVALWARNGALFARIALALMLLAALTVNLVAVSDVVGASSKVMDTAALFFALVALVAIFLPASGRYAKARKQAAA